MSTTAAKDLLTDLVSKSHFFFLGVGVGDGGISAGSISGTALIKLVGSTPPIKAAGGKSCTGALPK